MSRVILFANAAVLWIALFSLLSGCGKQQTGSPPPKGPTIEEVRDNPQAYAGATVTWELIRFPGLVVLDPNVGRFCYCRTPEGSRTDAEVVVFLLPGAEDLSPGYTYDVTGKVEPPDKLGGFRLTGCTATKRPR